MRHIALILAGLALASGAAIAQPAECEARVGYDRDRVMSGYILPSAAGERTCIPFSTVAAYPPAGYKGDFYVDEFSDERMRAQWATCKQEKACFERVSRAIKARQPPNREFETKNARHIYLLGKIAEGPEIDLKAIRRPGFFAAEPWKESIAQADPRTWIVEFTAPREPYERIHKKMTDPIKLRGWYIRGDGVDDGKGGRQRALVVMSGGGGTRTTAITDPNDRLYRIDATGKTHYIPVPSETSGASGQHHWRNKAAHLNRTGFDVLLFDRRGVGISGGYSDTNTHQQGRDLLAIVASLRTGDGMRAMSPDGETRKGVAAAESVRGGQLGGGLPVILFGNSRGTMATGWAMTKNFDRDCTLDLPEITCGPPLGDRTIKGAILFAEFTSGQGYVMDRPSVEDEERGLGRDRPLFIGGNEVENNLIFFPSSAILAGMSKWPAAFFARGLYDYAASLQGTVDSYSRVKGPKELVVVRGPHPFESWPAEERRRSQERAVAFAVALVQGKSRIDDARPWTNMKELVATAADVWEASTKPTIVPVVAASDKAAAARIEGKVVVYSVLSNRAAAPLVEDFRALHPGIEVVYDGEMGSTELVDRFLSETSQGKPTADVLWSSAMDLQVKLVEDGHAMTYVSPEAAALPPWAVYRDRAWGTTFEPVVFIYNKDRVSAEEVPRDHAAFARLLTAAPERFAGKVATFDIEKSGVGFMFAARDRRHFPALDELLRGFGRVGYQPSAGSGTMLEKVASGEYLLGYNIMGPYAMVRAKRQPSLGVVLPRDYMLVLSRVAFINRAAAHPNAARAWIDYVLSKRGQAVIGNRLELFAIRDDVDAEYSAARLSRTAGAAIQPIPLSAEIAGDLVPARRQQIIDGWNSAVAQGRQSAPAPRFHRLEATAPLKAEAPDWDYLSLDPVRGHLFIAARPDGMIVYDVNAKKVVTTLEDTKGANASVQVPEFDRIYTVNLDGTSTVFQLSTLKKLDKIKLGDDADAAFYDPVTKELAFMRGDSYEITYVAAATGQIVTRMKIGTKKLEASAADGLGNMFTASRDRNSVFKVDMRKHEVLAEYPAGCEEANGMAIDRANKRLFVGCRGKNPVLSVMDTETGKVIATLAIGRGNDGVIYDPETRKIYASSGVDGNIVIYNQVNPDTYKLAEATTTRPYARTMALDPKTKKLYLVTAEGTVDPSKKVNTAPAPFYPNRYFPGTFVLLTYSPQQGAK